MMFSRFASERVRCKDKVEMPLQMSCVDIEKTWDTPEIGLHGLTSRHGPGQEYVAKQVRCVYGTRDAGSICEDCCRDCLEGMGFLLGVASPCVFFHPEKNIIVVVHGDDFNALAVSDDLPWYEDQLKHMWIC